MRARQISDTLSFLSPLSQRPFCRIGVNGSSVVLNGPVRTAAYRISR